MGARDAAEKARAAINQYLKAWRIDHDRAKIIKQLRLDKDAGEHAAAVVELPPMPPLRPEFHRLLTASRFLLARISRRGWLLETLNHGAIRFAPAASYREIEDDEARVDDELVRSCHRPGGMTDQGH